MKYKLGDTLVEVTLAVGIFSMVAISIAAVMNGSTSSAQAALETTLAREEIDAQAEAIRFIHNAYLADENMGDDRYEKLWGAVSERAILPEGDLYKNFIEQTPTSCNTVYDDNEILDDLKAFVIDPRAIKHYSDQNINNITSTIDTVLIKATNNSSNQLIRASTHPRLSFSEKQFLNTDDLLGTSDSSNLYRAEGIYVVAVKGENEDEPSFYDFYIRTCWFGPGDDIPTSISTLIRLYNPKVASGGNASGGISGLPSAESNSVTATFNRGSYSGGWDISNWSGRKNSYITLKAPGVDYPGHQFKCWLNSKDGTCLSANTNYQVREATTFTAQWEELPQVHTHTIIYHGNGGNGSMANQSITSNNLANLRQNAFTRDGFTFLGWSTTQDGGVVYSNGQRYGSFSSDATINLYAKWRFDGGNIQDFSVARCRGEASASSKTVQDLRDQTLYRVRFANNQCWMIDDLAIQGVVTSTNSNFSNKSSVNLNTGDSSSSLTEPRSYSNSYNYCAATAGDPEACSSRGYYVYGKNGAGDICPSNWRMPTEREIAAVRQNNNIFSLQSDYGIWWTSTTLGLSNDSRREQLQCALERSGNEFIFNRFVTSCRSGSYWQGWFRDSFFQIRCVHQ